MARNIEARRRVQAGMECVALAFAEMAVRFKEASQSMEKFGARLRLSTQLAARRFPLYRADPKKFPWRRIKSARSS